MIARMALVAQKIKDKKAVDKDLGKEFEKVTAPEIYNDTEDALSKLAGGQQYS